MIERRCSKCQSSMVLYPEQKKPVTDGIRVFLMIFCSFQIAMGIKGPHGFFINIIGNWLEGTFMFYASIIISLLVGIGAACATENQGTKYKGTCPKCGDTFENIR